MSTLTHPAPAAVAPEGDRTPANVTPFAVGRMDQKSPTSLTNRSTNDDEEAKEPSAITEPVEEGPGPRTDWGIDTVKLSFEVDPNQSLTHSPFWTSVSSRMLPGSRGEDEVHQGKISFLTADVRVTLYAQSRRCHLEFNAARLTHGKSPLLWAPDGLVVLVERILQEVSPHACPTFIGYDSNGVETWAEDWASQVGIKRLDIARNLIIEDPALIKAALPSIECRYGKSKAQYASGKNGWTLVNSTSKSGVDRLYDKEAELATHDIECSLSESSGRLFRFEAQIQGDRLKKHGLTRLADVTDDRAWKALEARWSATGWGSPLPSSSGLLEALSGLSGVKTERLIGFLHLDATGQAASVLQPSHIRSQRKLARELGLTPGMPVELLGQARQHIDLGAGQLMPLAAVEPQPGVLASENRPTRVARPVLDSEASHSLAS
ncbi:hypothetical protein FOJ82_11120 [Tessaracoccus rhinocerotis]|uniref:Replication-associated protein G2P N-terminal domain-containing protein n=1 Tax=Tessaracoccus rhinocerotis TaxID=1689449 RepID=A0A553JZD2_9ACTN|nr:hypothetical protein [Tessaracoccus rhinocerotis]TRY17811.1 hypothetical protein FOJ82_11120 [Tessaracoccus rhinocerotis]